ncbi:MAG: sigma-54-dependent transcriptional regulator [Myxococcaceae bacterium]|nr:sigma-54-dependent transcriptional regulator [Myxococcaceae bacterium]
MPLLTLPSSTAHPLSVRAKALVFEDPKSRAALQRIHQLAPSDATVLITGETGTGKEIVARNIHALSARASRPFVAVNCGALTQSLIESELFGHEKGAFTGAITSKVGWFEAAHGGTLFLDEIGDLPLALQVKLLRVLQEGEVVRVGARQPIQIDVRLIAATNVDLAEAVAAGHFRGDLFFRLNVATVALPALRERPGDILPLANYFRELYGRRLNVAEAELSTAAADRLLAHSWPGNIRELENVMHHALLVCRDGVINAADLRLIVMPSTAKPSPASALDESPREGLARALLAMFEQEPENLHEAIEETVFRSAFHYCHKNQLQTARLLGISRNVVRARLMQYGELANAQRRVSEPERGSSAPRSFPPLQGPLRIGYQKFGWLPLLRARGEFERACAERGALVEWVDFSGGLQLVEAFSSLGLSFGVVGEGPPVIAQAQRVPMVYLAADVAAPDAEAIVVRASSPLRTVADLKGKKIALNRGANVHYLLIRALEEAGLSYADVETVFLPPEYARQAFGEGRVDAWAIWDPWLAALQHACDVRVLRDGRGLVDNTAYYIASRELSETHPEFIELFLTELDAASAWVRKDVERAAALLSPVVDVPQRALVTALGRKLSPSPVDAHRLAAQQRVADTFHEYQLIPHAVDVEQAQYTPSRWRERENERAQGLRY